MLIVRVRRKLDGCFYWELISDDQVVDQSEPFESADACLQAARRLGHPTIGIGGSKARRNLGRAGVARES